MGNCIKSNTDNQVKHDPSEGIEFSIVKDGIETSYTTITCVNEYIYAYVTDVVIDGRKYNLGPLAAPKYVAYATKVVFTRTKNGYRFKNYEYIAKLEGTYVNIPFYPKSYRHSLNAHIENNNRKIEDRYNLVCELYPKVVQTYKDYEFESDQFKLGVSLN